MIDKNATESMEQAVCYELRNIIKEHGAFYNSEHEGYAILLEEVEELKESVDIIQRYLSDLWTNIRNNEIKNINLDGIGNWARSAAEEAIQVAAVSEKFLSSVNKNTL